jgi:hypothetical protein
MGKVAGNILNERSRTVESRRFWGLCVGLTPNTVAARSKELSSLSRKLGSLGRILLKAWMSVCLYSMFVLFCV